MSYHVVESESKIGIPDLCIVCSEWLTKKNVSLYNLYIYIRSIICIN